MTQVHCSPDPRTFDLGKTRVTQLTKVGHPGYGRTKKKSLYLTPAMAADAEKRAMALGYATVNDYHNDLVASDLYGDLPEEEESDGPAPRLDATPEEVTPLSIEVPAGDPPREEPPLPKGPWQETFWKEVYLIVGNGDAWKWLGEGCFPLVEYGQVIELSVQNSLFKETILERELDQCVLLHCLNEMGIEKQLVIAVRPLTPEAPKATPKKEAPKDPVLAAIEEEIAAQQALDPRRSNEVVKGKISELTAQWYFRRRELKPPKQWQNHIAEWRLVSGKKGVSAFETTGPATRDDRKQASRVIKKDYS